MLTNWYTGATCLVTYIYVPIFGWFDFNEANFMQLRNGKVVNLENALNKPKYMLDKMMTSSPGANFNQCHYYDFVETSQY